MFDNLVKLSPELYVSLDGCNEEQYELFFYLACWTMGRNDLANKMIRAIDDPKDCKRTVIRAWCVAYCHLGKKGVKKITTKKAKKIFSKEPNVCGDFLETKEPRLWTFVDNQFLQKITPGMVAVVQPLSDDIVLIPHDRIPPHCEFSLADLYGLEDQLLCSKSAPATTNVSPLAIEESDKLRTELRPTLLNHLLTDENPRRVLGEIKNNQVMFIQTAEFTSYGVISFTGLVEMVPVDEQEDVDRYLKENSGKTLVAYQEDDLPIFTYAFEEKELRS